MIYNNPATSGVDMSPELIVRMFNNLCKYYDGKESSGDIQRMHKIYELSKVNFRFITAVTLSSFRSFMRRASGWCTAAPNLLGQRPQQLIEYVKW